MDDVLLLFLLALAMLVCSFLAGSLPLLVNLSEEKLNLVTALGAGLLVGAALAVIIPEGVGAVYSHQDHAHETAGGHPHEDHAVAAAAAANLPVVGGIVDGLKDKLSSVVGDAKLPTESHNEPQHGSWIGASLVLGFIFMLFVDQISSRLGDSSGRNQRNQITATLGLVVHAAADGIALGASATTKHLEMEMIVFFAIMLHKAPTAFGLVTFLLHEGMDRVRIRKHLLIFSLSAPIGSLVTYFLITMGTNSMAPSDSSSGLVLLFSGGTFLYVATVHVLPEISGSPHSHGGGGPPSPISLESNTPVASSSSPKAMPITHFLALVVGAVCPVFLSMGHSH
ncbi:putative Zinc transporter ZIP9 [Hypsibius exemplaris]|uniref:Zinc transporter ZIP9 n=1 Tax=Hypsibius exemplaris TaxID=2072580 RepID=A0A1W0WSZ0_HYPEX|nr:putative Zinc transporter ZIP9 [Hypsibius exemplaris]